MNRLPMLVLLAVTTVSHSACQSYSPSVLDSEADRAAIEELVERELQATLSGDVDGFMSIRASNFVALPPGLRAIEGSESVREFISISTLAGVVTSAGFDVQEIVMSEDLAVAHVRYSASFAPADGSASIDGVGRFLFVAKRQSEGDWKWTHLIWNEG